MDGDTTVTGGSDAGATGGDAPDQSTEITNAALASFESPGSSSAAAAPQDETQTTAADGAEAAGQTAEETDLGTGEGVEGAEAESQEATEAGAEAPDRIAQLFEQMEQMLAGDGEAGKPEAPAAAAPPAAPQGARTPPAAAAAPAAGEDPFAGIMKDATEEYGEPLATKVVKPLVAAFETKLAAEVAKIRQEFAPAQQMTKAVEAARVEAARQTITKFADANASIYGKNAAEREKNPAFKKAYVEDIKAGAMIQQFFGSKGELISDQDAMAMAMQRRTGKQSVSATREQVIREMRPRSNQRSAVPGKTAAAPAGKWQEEVTSEAEKHFG